MEMNHVDGQQVKTLTLFTLSTCIWCKMTKKLLEKMNIGYDYVDVDLLKDDEKSLTMENLKKHNPKCSFPSLVIDGETCIVGFDEEKIREAVTK